ncbi:MAG TPA: SMC family ATPase [Acidimicrobiia bacterium]|jgi:exonuclease SbcC
MRPVRLVVRGFAAFRDEVELDFADTDFFALVGPTGAGKSSVIDAICFALYGSVPRYEHASLKAPVVTTNATEARVELDFSSGGERYRIVRTVRRKGNGKVQLDRLAADGTLAEPLTSSVSDTKRLVPAIVGLKFDEFTKCVVLPQGAFATLLHANDADRNELLTSVLGLGVYDEIARLAHERERQIGADITADERVLDDLGAVDDVALDAAATRLTALKALFKDVDAARSESAVLNERAVAARADLAAAKRAIDALEGVRVAPEVSAIAGEREALGARLGAAEQAHVGARAELDAATKVMEQGRSVRDVEAVVQAHHKLVQLDAARAEHTARHMAAVDAAARTAAAAGEAEAALEGARAAVDAARAAHAAHALSARLVVGEPCPVCEQVVDSLDAVAQRARPVAVARAEKEQDGTTRAHDAARKAMSTTEHAVTSIAAQLEALEARRAELLAAVAPIPDADAAEAALVAAETAAAAVNDACKRAGVAFDEERDARQALRDYDGRVEAIGSAFHAQRDEVAAAHVAGVPVPTGVLAADWTQLHEWARTEAGAWRAKAATIEAGCASVDAEARALVARVAAPLEQLDVAVTRGASLDDVRDAVIEAGTDARHRHERLVEARARAAELTEQLSTRREQLEVARALRNHLRTTNFKTWLLARAVHALAARATDRLLELSGGRYELVLGEGDDFEVVDRNNAGERRPVRSLSGGETFEASLALALALAEQVAVLSSAGATSLESIFLDEGFGTLDPDALELVAGAVETLGGEGRMVGIVTHVGALAERVPVRFRVANNGRTATITREG